MSLWGQSGRATERPQEGRTGGRRACRLRSVSTVDRFLSTLSESEAKVCVLAPSCSAVASGGPLRASRPGFRAAGSMILPPSPHCPSPVVAHMCYRG
jgi:hypothetical protein